MSNSPKLVGDKIRSIRRLKGWTQEELAERPELHYSYIGGVERGDDRNISLEALGKIINALEISPAELFQFEDHAIDQDFIDKKEALDFHRAFLSERNLNEIRMIHKTCKEIFRSMDGNRV